jgi:gamma-glutamyltranspeptidase/glutathione hydrolase
MAFNNGGILDMSRIVRRASIGRQSAATFRSLGGTALVALVAGALGGCSVVGDLLGSSEEPAPATGEASAPRPVADQKPEAAPANTETTRVRSAYLGSLAADDPQAVDIGRQILVARGTAADAAAAMGMALTVTLPSRAGIDGAGVCLVHEPESPTVQEIDFVPPQVAGSAQIPGLVRGLAVLQAREGVLRWQQAVGVAEKLALSGIAVTPPLYADLNAIGMASGLTIGDVLPQRSVAATLARLRVAGASDIHTGETAGRLIAAGVPASDLAKWLPTWRAATLAGSGETRIYVGGGPGGKLAAAAWDALVKANPADPAASFAAAQSVQKVDSFRPVAATSFAVTDARGQGVGCSIGMGALFGTGKLIPGLDVYAAAPIDPGAFASIVAVSGNQLTGVFTGGGSQASALDAAAAAWQVLQKGRPVDTALRDPRNANDGSGQFTADRLNAVSCPDGSPREAGRCVAAFDPRGGGYAMTADRF